MNRKHNHYKINIIIKMLNHPYRNTDERIPNQNLQLKTNGLNEGDL
jgi:hypothetical protein